MYQTIGAILTSNNNASALALAHLISLLDKLNLCKMGPMRSMYTSAEIVAEILRYSLEHKVNR